MQKSRIEELHDLLVSEPKDSFLKYALALEYQKVGNAAMARRVMEELLNNDPGYLAAYFPLGQNYEESHEFDKAADVYSRGIGLAEKRNDRHHMDFLMRALSVVQKIRP